MRVIARCAQIHDIIRPIMASLLQRLLAMQPELLLYALASDPRSLVRLAATCRQARAVVMGDVRLWRT